MMDEAAAHQLVEPVAELVTFEEACKLRGVTRHELWKRVIRCSMLTELEVQEAVNEYERLLKGLAAASAGRVFFARGGAEGSEDGASFWAYDWGVTIPPRTVCLDGTVDLNKMRAATLDVVQVDGIEPSYAGTEVHLVDMPAEVQAAKPRKGRFNKRSDIERDVFGWLKAFILDKTVPNDRVLVYWKRSLHEQDFTGTTNPEHETWQGREVHFASFDAPFAAPPSPSAPPQAALAFA